MKVAWLLLPLLALARDDAGHRQGAAQEREEQFTEEKCKAVVTKVQEKGQYTEESIQPICAEEMHSPKCDFFAEALSLASSHADFNDKRFCGDIAEARFCSGTMDKLLRSVPVADLAYGECVRRRPGKGEAYCGKFQKMLGYAVQNEDLDTMRACYMIEAYANLEPQATNRTEDSPKARIIGSSSKELNDFGDGKGKVKPTEPPKPGIVVQPEPLDQFGEGKSGAAAPAAADLAAAPADASAGRIVVPGIRAPASAQPAASLAAIAVTVAKPTAPTVPLAVTREPPSQQSASVLGTAVVTKPQSAAPAMPVAGANPRNGATQTTPVASRKAQSVAAASAVAEVSTKDQASVLAKVAEAKSQSAGPAVPVAAVGQLIGAAKAARVAAPKTRPVVAPVAPVALAGDKSTASKATPVALAKTPIIASTAEAVATVLEPSSAKPASLAITSKAAKPEASPARPQDPKAPGSNASAPASARKLKALTAVAKVRSWGQAMEVSKAAAVTAQKPGNRQPLRRPVVKKVAALLPAKSAVVKKARQETTTAADFGGFLSKFVQ